MGHEMRNINHIMIILNKENKYEKLNILEDILSVDSQILARQPARGTAATFEKQTRPTGEILIKTKALRQKNYS